MRTCCYYGLHPICVQSDSITFQPTGGASWANRSKVCSITRRSQVQPPQQTACPSVIQSLSETLICHLTITPATSFIESRKTRTKARFTSSGTWKVDCSSPAQEKKKVPSAEEFLHEKVTDISSLQWHGDKSGKSYRAALHSLQYLLPVLIIRLIKPVGGGRTVTFCFSGEGEGMANWGREGREGQFLIYYITRWMNRCAFRKKERDSHQNKYGA